MSISSQEITTSATLEQFRVQFNNLVADVQGLESGTASFSNIEVKEDGNLTFEGATNDGFETTTISLGELGEMLINRQNAAGTWPYTEWFPDGEPTKITYSICAQGVIWMAFVKEALQLKLRDAARAAPRARL